MNQLLSSCGLVLLNPPKVGTHSAGVALDLVMMSSSCSGSVGVHNGMGCCNHTPGCCPFLGSEMVCALQQPRFGSNPCSGASMLFSCGPTWAQEVDMCLCGDIPAMNIIGFALISRTTVNPLGGLLSVWPCALPAMFGGVPPIPFHGDPFPFQGCQVPLNCAHGANACSGLIGRNVCLCVVGSMVRSPTRPPRGRRCLCRQLAPAFSSVAPPPQCFDVF